MPHYEFKHVPDTPLTRVYVDGVCAQEFTSLYAAKCWVEHIQKLHREWEMDANIDQPCQCYGCVTMRKPCINDPRT